MKCNPPSVTGVVSQIEKNSSSKGLKTLVSFSLSTFSTYAMKEGIENTVEAVNSSNILKFLGQKGVNKRLVSYPLLAVALYFSREDKSVLAGALTGVAVQELNSFLGKKINGEKEE